MSSRASTRRKTVTAAELQSVKSKLRPELLDDQSKRTTEAPVLTPHQRIHVWQGPVSEASAASGFNVQTPFSGGSVTSSSSGERSSCSSVFSTNSSAFAWPSASARKHRLSGYSFDSFRSLPSEKKARVDGRGRDGNGVTSLLSPSSPPPSSHRLSLSPSSPPDSAPRSGSSTDILSTSTDSAGSPLRLSISPALQGGSESPLPAFTLSLGDSCESPLSPSALSPTEMRRQLRQRTRQQLQRRWRESGPLSLADALDEDADTEDAAPSGQVRLRAPPPIPPLMLPGDEQASPRSPSRSPSSASTASLPARSPSPPAAASTTAPAPAPINPAIDFPPLSPSFMSPTANTGAKFVFTSCEPVPMEDDQHDGESTPPVMSPRSSLVAALSPDPRAFAEGNSLLKKTPDRIRLSDADGFLAVPGARLPAASDQRPGRHLQGHARKDSMSAYQIRTRYVPPPTPARDKIKRPSRIMRHDSLLDNKLLVGLHFEEKHTGNIFEDEFEDHKLVGQGSFFQTFRAKERKTGVFYAIKRSMHTFRGRKERDQMLQEIKLVHMLGPHDNIIKYFRAWQEEQHFFVQLEACSCNLADFVALMPSRGMPVDQRFLLFCTRQIAQGLAHIHRSDLIHLDVKPANVLVWDYLSDYQPSMPSLEPTPQTPRTKNAKLQALLKQAYAGRYILKLGDFGQALLRDKWSDGAEGDAQYMAPELLRSDKPSTKADIFSLGLLLFELATNTILPKSGKMWHELREGNAKKYLQSSLPISPTSGRKMRLLPAFEALMLSMLEPQPSKRPSAEEILQTLPLIEEQAERMLTRPQHRFAFPSATASSGST